MIVIDRIEGDRAVLEIDGEMVEQLRAFIGEVGANNPHHSDAGEKRRSGTGKTGGSPENSFAPVIRGLDGVQPDGTDNSDF